MTTEWITTATTESGKCTKVQVLSNSLGLVSGWQQISVQLRSDGFNNNAKRIYLESTSHSGLLIKPETHIVKQWEMISGVTMSWQLALNKVPAGTYQCSLIVDDGVVRERLIIPLLILPSDQLFNCEQLELLANQGSQSSYKTI